MLATTGTRPRRAGRAMRWTAVGILVVGTIGVLIYLFPQVIRGHDLHWTEEVKIADGRVLSVARVQHFDGPAYPLQMPGPSDFQLRFSHPDTGISIDYRGTSALMPVFLTVYESQVLLILEPTFRNAFLYLGCPDPPFLLFEFSQSEWKWKSLDSFPLREFRSNMIKFPEGRQKESLRGWGSVIGLDVTTKLTRSGRPYIVNLSNAAPQRTSDGKPFKFAASPEYVSFYRPLVGCSGSVQDELRSKYLAATKSGEQA